MGGYGFLYPLAPILMRIWIIGELCTLAHPDTLQCLQAYAEKKLTDPQERAKMWDWVLERSEKGSDLQIQGLKGFVSEIPLFEQPGVRVELWKKAYDLIAGGDGLCTQVVRGYADEIGYFDNPQERADMWNWVLDRSPPGSDLDTEALENLEAIQETIQEDKDAVELSSQQEEPPLSINAEAFIESLDI